MRLDQIVIESLKLSSLTYNGENGVSTFSRLFFYLRTFQNVLMALLAGSKVSDRCPLGYLFYFSLLIVPFISSPEPKAQKVSLKYTNQVGVRASVCVSTLSNMNISITSGPIATKFHLKHYWGGGKDALGIGPDRIRTLVSMAIYSSHRVIMGKML